MKGQVNRHTVYLQYHLVVHSALRPAAFRGAAEESSWCTVHEYQAVHKQKIKWRCSRSLPWPLGVLEPRTERRERFSPAAAVCLYSSLVAFHQWVDDRYWSAQLIAYSLSFSHTHMYSHTHLTLKAAAEHCQTGSVSSLFQGKAKGCSNSATDDILKKMHPWYHCCRCCCCRHHWGCCLPAVWLHMLVVCLQICQHCERMCHREFLCRVAHEYVFFLKREDVKEAAHMSTHKTSNTFTWE